MEGPCTGGSCGCLLQQETETSNKERKRKRDRERLANRSDRAARQRHGGSKKGYKPQEGQSWGHNDWWDPGNKKWANQYKALSWGQQDGAVSGEGVSADPQTGYQPQKSSANASSSYWGPSPKDSSSPPAKWVWVPPSNRPDIVTEAGTYVRFVAKGANEASGSGGGRVGRSANRRSATKGTKLGA